MALVGAFVAALVAHVAIDVAGDYLLAHDTYDDHAHGSRYVASIAILIAASAAVYAYARVVIAETCGTRGALHAALRSSVPTSTLAFVAIVVSLALPVLLGMAWLDALVAGARIDDGIDLFGGSLGLGIGMATLASLATAIGLRSFVALVAHFHRSIVRVAFAIVHAIVPQLANVACLGARRTDALARVAAFVARCTGADPPAATIGAGQA
jgi:hypothetical protein